MAESNCTRCHFCQPAFARAAIPGQELAATRRSHSKESCININEQTPPRDAPNTWGLSTHTASPVWCGLSPPWHSVEKPTPHKGLGLSSSFGTVSIAVPCWKQEMVGASIFFRCMERCHPCDKWVLHSGVVLKIKTTAPTQTKQRCLAHHIHLYTIQITPTSPLISNSSHSLHLNDNPRSVCSNFWDEATGPLAELKSFLLLRAGGLHNFLHRRGKSRVI